MSKAVVISRAGGPEVLEFTDVEVTAPGRGQVLLRQTAIGVNFHDVYVRSGQYATLPLPGVPGIEACGVVEQVGDDVSGIAVGDRVAYATGRYGAYAERRVIDARQVVVVPAGVEDAAAASLMIKGTTAAMLLFKVARVGAGDTILVHAAAGGVGRLLTQWARHLGATVIGTVGGPGKVAVAMAAGCHHVLDYTRQDFVQEVDRITGNEGAQVVYDSVGKSTFAGSLACVSRCGHLVNFGQSSGPVPPLEMGKLAARSATVSRPVIFDYLADRTGLEMLAGLAFSALRDRVITLDDFAYYPLAHAKDAHRDLEQRVLVASPVLLP